MNRIQKLFELIAGISQEEQHRWAIAQDIFYAPRLNVHALQTPACWRRKTSRHGIKR
ncbi:MAG: hypothetical protein WCL27_09750 [Betaproteobacteria bacterium]